MGWKTQGVKTFCFELKQLYVASLIHTEVTQDIIWKQGFVAKKDI